MKRYSLCLIFFVVGCSVNQVKFDLAIPKETSLTRKISSVPGDSRRVKGESCLTQIIGIPLGGFPQIEEAMQKALKQAGTTSLRDVELKWTWSNFVVGQTICEVVEGIPAKVTN